ncbi:right-handed parallel beta-helix repeat-containing protein, partial [Rhizobium johnstonii]
RRRGEGKGGEKEGGKRKGKEGKRKGEREGEDTDTADAAKLAGLSGDVSDTVHYKIADGTALHCDTETLSVSIHVDDLL